MIKSNNKINLIIIILGFTTLLNAQYTEIWNVDVSYTYVGTQNTDSDNQKEIVFAGYESDGDHIYVIDGATGNFDWDSGSWSTIYYGSGSSAGLQNPIHPRLIDIDSDGIYEILFCGRQFDGDESMWHLYSFTGGTGNVSGDYLPRNPKLSQNFPNPFNPSTTIEFSLEKSGDVKIQIFNIKGQLVETLVDNYKTPGSYSVNWNPSSLSSGQYFYQIVVDGQPVSTKKAIFLK